MEAYLGQIMLFAGNFAPTGWMFCEGQLLRITDNQALFSVLGVTYGGDGRTTFALPDLRGRAPIHPGAGPGLSHYDPGQRGGAETHTLTTGQLPAHTHPATAKAPSPPRYFLSPSPHGTVWVDGTEGNPYEEMPTETDVTVGETGGGLPVNNMQPYLAINYIIAVQGIFPSRN